MMKYSHDYSWLCSSTTSILSALPRNPDFTTVHQNNNLLFGWSDVECHVINNLQDHIIAGGKYG